MSYGASAGPNLLPFSSQLGRYRILEPLGQGATAVVYRAQDLTGRQVAFKVLNPAAASQPHMRSCFQLEYQTLARLRHPGILRVYESGEANGRLFIAMELVEGGTLEEFLMRAKSIGEVAAIDIARQVAEALNYLHESGKIHRDVKISNVLLGPSGRAVLFDFGTVYDTYNPADHAPGIYGTPAFLAPEQIRSKGEPDKRSDLYSLGIVLYLMVTGRRPFYGSREEVLDAHLAQTPPPPSAWGWVSPELEQIILRALAKKPEDRFESGDEFAMALRGVDVVTEQPKPRLATRLRAWLEDTVRQE